MLQYTYQTEIKISEENGKYLWIGHFVNCNHIRPLYRVVPQTCGLKLHSTSVCVIRNPKSADIKYCRYDAVTFHDVAELPIHGRTITRSLTVEQQLSTQPVDFNQS